MNLPGTPRLNGKRRSVSSAFTLVEMLVAVVILTLIMLALLTMTNTVNLTWLVNSNKAEVLQTGRAVLNQISRDLSASLLRPDFKTQYLQMIENPDLSGTPLNTNPKIVSGTDTLFWQSALAKFINQTPPTLDHLTVAGYYLADDSTTKQRSLYRFYSERPLPSQAYNSNPAYNLYQVNPSKAAGWLTGGLLATTSSIWDGSASAGQGATILTQNVLGLWIRCRDVNGYPIPYAQVQDPSTTSVKYDSSWNGPIPSGSASLNGNGGGTSSRLPASIEVSIVCIDSRSLSRLQAQGKVLPTITAVTDPSDGITDPNPALVGDSNVLDKNTNSDSYRASIVAFMNSAVFTSQKGIELQSFTVIIPLLNGSYAKRYGP